MYNIIITETNRSSTQRSLLYFLTLKSGSAALDFKEGNHADDDVSWWGS